MSENNSFWDGGAKTMFFTGLFLGIAVTLGLVFAFTFSSIMKGGLAGAQAYVPAAPTQPTQPTAQQPTTPSKPVAAVDPKSDHIRGPANAKVTMIEYSDFQCSYCVRARPLVARVREVYGDQVRFAFRHFPLDFHAQAEKAGEGAACAGEQGKFWEMHDLLWTNTAKLQVPDLKVHAATLGLDAAAFATCLDSGRYAHLVESDVEAGQGYGVSGTPAFFVNGRPLVGAQPFDAFAQVIDDELARQGLASPRATTK